jgi:hypothetical protein
MSKKNTIFLLFIIAVIAIGYLVAGCTFINTTVTVKPGFSNYRKIALFWRNGGEEIYENFFLANWMSAFPRQTLVERTEISQVIREQDLLPGRLNSSTRARLREVFGVDALILVVFHGIEREYIFPKRVVNLSIKVVDTDTGEITVSAVSQGEDRTIDAKIVEAIRMIEGKTRAVP